MFEVFENHVESFFVLLQCRWNGRERKAGPSRGGAGIRDDNVTVAWTDNVGAPFTRR